MEFTKKELEIMKDCVEMRSVICDPSDYQEMAELGRKLGVEIFLLEVTENNVI